MRIPARASWSGVVGRAGVLLLSLVGWEIPRVLSARRRSLRSRRTGEWGEGVRVCIGNQAGEERCSPARCGRMSPSLLRRPASQCEEDQHTFLLRQEVQLKLT